MWLEVNYLLLIHTNFRIERIPGAVAQKEQLLIAQLDFLFTGD
jgi:hypothetical protein